jgi:hypothetical protein
MPKGRPWLLVMVAAWLSSFGNTFSWLGAMPCGVSCLVGDITIDRQETIMVLVIRGVEARSS